MQHRKFIVLSGSAGFDPSTIPGYVTRWKSDTGLYQDSAKTTPATADGHRVGAWADIAGLGYDLLQATDGKRGTLKLSVAKNQPVVRFANTDSGGLQTAAFPSALSQPNTIFAVFRIGPWNSTGSQYHNVTDGIAVGSRHCIHKRALISGVGSALAASSINGATDMGTYRFMVACGIFNGGSSKLYRDSTLYASGDVGAHTLTGLTVGMQYDGTTNYAAMDICDIVLINGAISDTNRAYMVSGLSNLYQTIYSGSAAFAKAAAPVLV